MKIVIPMSGFGERFRRAGHKVPKPLILVDGKPIIAHVLDLFVGETDIVFICNRDHLDNPDFRMREILTALCPTGEIVAIAPHKLGPVYAVTQVLDRIRDDEPVVVNYCDFTAYWDWAHFRLFVAKTACEGAIPCYRGFHPHMLGSINYAYVRESGGWVSDIQEKQPYTDTPSQEFASSGTYYFRSGALVKRYFRAMLDKPALALNGEYYVSLVYKLMLRDELAIVVYDLQHFMQWGTPQDLREYLAWSRTFGELVKGQRQPSHPGTVLIPMAGFGSRFSAAGYVLPKPLIEVSGRPMVLQAVRDLPRGDRYVFVLRQDMPGLDAICAALKDEFPTATLVLLDQPTDGQARTCLMAFEQVPHDLPLTIGACDNGALYDADAFDALMADPHTDVIVWAARGHPGAIRNPQMYGWLDIDPEGWIRNVSVKMPLNNPVNDPIVTGTFTFRRAGEFKRAAERMIARDARINGEFYVDTCINDAIALGLRVRIFTVDSYLGWGTPDDLRTFEYWQSCFHKWEGHDYILDQDRDVAPDRAAVLAQRFAAVLPELPPPFGLPRPAL